MLKLNLTNQIVTGAIILNNLLRILNKNIDIAIISILVFATSNVYLRLEIIKLQDKLDSVNNIPRSKLSVEAALNDEGPLICPEKMELAFMGKNRFTCVPKNSQAVQ
jgi:hypothetical protein